MCLTKGNKANIYQTYKYSVDIIFSVRGQMQVKCNYCGRIAMQIGKEVFYCKDCDMIVTVSEEDKEKLPEIY